MWSDSRQHLVGRMYMLQHAASGCPFGYLCTLCRAPSRGATVQGEALGAVQATSLTAMTSQANAMSLVKYS